MAHMEIAQLDPEAYQYSQLHPNKGHEKLVAVRSSSNSDSNDN